MKKKKNSNPFVVLCGLSIAVLLLWFFWAIFGIIWESLQSTDWWESFEAGWLGVSIGGAIVMGVLAAIYDLGVAAGKKEGQK
jgi:hypothetical protein